VERSRLHLPVLCLVSRPRDQHGKQGDAFISRPATAQLKESTKELAYRLPGGLQPPRPLQVAAAGQR
jgi:hypothetical protein